jgi:hypothetical protein
VADENLILEIAIWFMERGADFKTRNGPAGLQRADF